LTRVDEGPIVPSMDAAADAINGVFFPGLAKANLIAS
jgi:hypothetical protein